jgi:hypothetical protein
LLDAGEIPLVHGYAGLYHTVRTTLDETHMEGRLKEEILADPGRFVVPDPDVVLTLLDQRFAGKRLVLITNSEWAYTNQMMSYAFDPHLPGDRRWRGLFDAVVVSAAKPAFHHHVPSTGWSTRHEGSCNPTSATWSQGRRSSGDVRRLENHLGLSGDQILTSETISTRRLGVQGPTPLAHRPHPARVEQRSAPQAFAPAEEQLVEFMDRKTRLEEDLAHARPSIDSAPATGTPCLTEIRCSPRSSSSRSGPAHPAR